MKISKKTKDRLKKTILVLLGVVLVVFVAVILFLKLWKPFGASADSEKRNEYSARAENFDGRIFYNETEFQIMSSVPDGAVDEILSAKSTLPLDALPVMEPAFLEKPQLDQVTVTWFGHSSLLMQMHGMNILLDPVLSKMASPVSFVGSKRFSDLPVSVEELPQIDILILSHDHYDHLDYSTIMKLDKKVEHYIVPLGVENHLERWGVSSEKIISMAWWEETQLGGLTIGCTPARHYSGRSLTDRFATLWASWVLKDEYHLIYESGDSGYDKHYKEIHDKYGDFDFALVDCAQYDPQWKDVHQTPEEAFLALTELGVADAMPIHWGAFVLANHPWDDSIVRLVKAAEGSQMNIVTPQLGQTIDLNDLSAYCDRWYESVR